MTGPNKSITELVAELNDAVDQNKEVAQHLDSTIQNGNKIVRRKTLWVMITCASILIDVIVTIGLAIALHGVNNLQHQKDNQATALRANTCNLSLLLLQSIKSGTNTVDLYRGLKPILATDDSPEALKAVEFIDRSIANIDTNRKIRENFIELSAETQRDLDCPDSFILTGDKP